MSRSAKRNMLLLILSLAVPWMVVSLYGFFAAERGGVYEVTRSWCLDGPGGRYGALEWEAYANNQRVARETQFFFGPLRGSLPFSAPVSIVVIAVLYAAPVLVALHLRHAQRHTPAA
jgi:hypothetical protein